MLADLLRPWSATLADGFRSSRQVIPTIDSMGVASRGSGGLPDIAPDARIAMLVGPDATRCAPAVHELADHLGTPVANTWGAKGIYPWDDRHHMGTCGLQRDDFELLGFGGLDLVLAVGTDPWEAPNDRLPAVPTAFEPADATRLAFIRRNTEPRPMSSASNELYARIAAIAQPGYVNGSAPRHPARAVMDLKESLGATTRVTAQPGLAGLWVARTFPTDRMGSVIVPAEDRPGIGAAVGLVSAGSGTDTICVVPDEIDDVTAEVVAVATHHELPLRVEIWGDDVDWSRTEDLIAAAGPVVAWTA